MGKQEIVPVVNVEKLYVAKLLKDDETGVEFDTPRYLPGVKEISIKPKISSEPFYAEGIKWLEEVTLSDIDVGINVADLTDEDEAFLLGHKLAAEGGIIRAADDVAPDVAVLTKFNKAKGIDKYKVLYKGSFMRGDETAKGKEGKTNYQSKQLKAGFQPLRHNKMTDWDVSTDSPNVIADIDTKFFEKVIIPKEKTTTTIKTQP